MNEWRSAALGACLVLGGGLAAAQEADDTIDSVRNDYMKLLRENSAKQEKAKLPDGVFLPLATEADLIGFIERCWKIYDRNEGESNVEFDALNQVMNLSTNVESDKLADHWRDAADKLFASFLDDDRMVVLALNIPAPKKYGKLAAQYTNDLKTKSKSVAVKAALVYGDLQLDVRKSSEGGLNEAQEKELVAKLEKLAADFGEQKVPRRDVTYADYVKTQLYMMEHLKVGAVAPEIEAKDLDGVGFKLSDYRGKVVMLDFWGYW